MLGTHFAKVYHLHTLIENAFRITSLQENSFVPVLNFGHLSSKVLHVGQVLHYLTVEESHTLDRQAESFPAFGVLLDLLEFL